MNAREHHVIGRAPNWSRWSHAFRHLDGRACDWRHAKPGWPRPRDAERDTDQPGLEAFVVDQAGGFVARPTFWQRLGGWALAFFIHPDPAERRKIYIYLVVATWVVMCTIGILAAHGIHP